MGCRLRIPCVEALNLTASLPSGVLGPRFESVLELMMPPHSGGGSREGAWQNTSVLLFAGYLLRRGGAYLLARQRLPVALHELRLHAMYLFVQVLDHLHLTASFFVSVMPTSLARSCCSLRLNVHQLRSLVLVVANKLLQGPADPLGLCRVVEMPLIARLQAPLLLVPSLALLPRLALLFWVLLAGPALDHGVELLFDQLATRYVHHAPFALVLCTLIAPPSIRKSLGACRCSSHQPPRAVRGDQCTTKEACCPEPRKSPLLELDAEDRHYGTKQGNNARSHKQSEIVQRARSNAALHQAAPHCGQTWRAALSVRMGRPALCEATSPLMSRRSLSVGTHLCRPSYTTSTSLVINSPAPGRNKPGRTHG